MNSWDKQISDYMDEIGDDTGILDDYTIIDEEVRFRPTCSLGELYPDAFDEFGNQLYPL